MQAERRKFILEMLNKQHSVSVSELREQFDVSEMTIRRDLHALEAEGLLRRTHGGAISNLGRSYEPLLRVRSSENTGAKEAIGWRAAEMIQDGDSIALDVGSTTLEIARSLKNKHNLTIVTASLPIAVEIATNHPIESDIRLILTGGIVRAGELSMIGEIARLSAQNLHVDIAFIGVGGISIKEGLTEYNLEDTQVKKALLEAAHRKVVVADSSKFGRTTFATIAPLESVDTIITDAGISEELIEAFQQKQMPLIIVDF